MTESLLTIDVDTRALLAALDAMPNEVLAYLKPAAKITADNIAHEMHGRIARRTGATAEGITVEETHNGEGYVVFVKSPHNPNLPLWLEVGTKFMTPRDFFFASAALEEGPHQRRSLAAIQEAIDAHGLGDA